MNNSSQVRRNRTQVRYLCLCHVACAINLVVHVCRNQQQLGVNESLGWLVFALMYACMEVNTTPDRLRVIRLISATLAVWITAALAVS